VLSAGSEASAAGRWAASRTAAASQRWEGKVANRDGALEGTVTIEGSPVLRSGVVQGRVEGNGVWGTLTDGRGREVATFTGTITDGGRVHGRYRDASGEAGTWEREQPFAP